MKDELCCNMSDIIECLRKHNEKDSLIEKAENILYLIEVLSAKSNWTIEDFIEFDSYTS